MATAMAIHCEAASMLGSRLGLRDQVTVALRHGFERWDGKGHPGRLAAEEIPLATRISVLARDVLLWRRLGAAAAARDIVVRRRGKAYDPEVVDAYLRSAEDVADVSWEDFLASEPSPHWVAADELDRLLEVFADFADLKIPFALGHSRRVSALAAGAGQVLGLDHDRIAGLRRAGLLHDLGRTGVSNRIWEKPGPLSGDDWERVRLHPYYTERISVSMRSAGGSGRHGRLPSREVERLGVPPACDIMIDTIDEAERIIGSVMPEPVEHF
jgi:HD-GYP domain-containing protein (c-di-GMP phosphodiesterase class II)